MSKGSGGTRATNSRTAHGGDSMATELIQAVKDNHRKTVSEKRAEIAALQGSLSNQRKETEAKVQKIQGQIQERKEALKDLAEYTKAQIQRAKEKISDLSEQSKWIKASNDSFKNNKNQIDEQIAKLREQINTIKQENLNVVKKIQGQINDRKRDITQSSEYTNKKIQEIRNKSNK